MSPTRRPAGSRTEKRLGARAHHIHTSNRAHAPRTTNNPNHDNPDAALDGVSQAGFDGGLDSRILSSGEETLPRHGPSKEVPA
jgi:hypothetical protein